MMAEADISFGSPPWSVRLNPVQPPQNLSYPCPANAKISGQSSAAFDDSSFKEALIEACQGLRIAVNTSAIGLSWRDGIWCSPRVELEVRATT
jgi:hypothetical protein